MRRLNGKKEVEEIIFGSELWGYRRQRQLVVAAVLIFIFSAIIATGVFALFFADGGGDAPATDAPVDATDDSTSEEESTSRDIIERVESAERAMRDMGKDKKALTLGVPPMIGSLVLPVIYGEFVSKSSDICLNIVECGREQMLKKVTDGQIDMAFISHDRGLDEDFCGASLGALEMVCSASVDSEIAKKNTLTPNDLLDTPLVMFKDGFFQTDKIKAWFSKGGIEPQILMKTDQLSTITKLITAGTAVGFMFKRLIENDKSVAFCPLSPKITVNVSLIWQRDRFFSSAMKRFKSFIEKTEIFK